MLEGQGLEVEGVALHLPLTPETYHLVDAESISRMKAGAMLINTSRGALVDARAVIDASGTWTQPNPLGASGLPALGEPDAAAVIGNGNVALDCARILAKTPAEFVGSDIVAHAFEALGNAKIRTIHLLGRRGPVDPTLALPYISVNLFNRRRDAALRGPVAGYSMEPA